MYNPSFRVKKNGVPVVSKKELDAIGERFVRDFQPDVLRNPAPVDIDGFIECYLGMTPDYQFLSHNGIYLGMTVFNDTNKVPVFDPVNQRAEYITAKARTVIIDNRLLEENQQHRYRFTLGHEASHDILHSGFFSYNPDQMSMGKVKLLLDVIEDIRSLADSLEAVADAMTHSDPPAAEPEAPKAAPTPVNEDPAPATKAMSKEELRAFLGEKSLAGHRDTIQALIRKYGGKKFSDVDPSHYPALQKDAEELPDAT